MKKRCLQSSVILLGISLAAAVSDAMSADILTPVFWWNTVVNNGDYMPTDDCNPEVPNIATCRHFNSYNQPSVNAKGLVVMRARSKGGQKLGQPTHGIYTRDMATNGPIVKILDRNTLVPEPNNRDTLFTETPSFPRIDMWTGTLATRGNHGPVWKVLNEEGETIEQLGTTGIYTNPFGNLYTGTSKLGIIPDFWFFEVPEYPGTSFDVFPGAPAVTNGNTLVFKGNYTVDNVSKTGAYYRKMSNAPFGGMQPVSLIANNDTLIPGTSVTFGSVAPPSAAGNYAVFAGFDNENNPTAGGIYLAPLYTNKPVLKPLVTIGSQVPDETQGNTFNMLSEGLSFDGRFVAFWGAWGADSRRLRLYCQNEGNKDVIAYCKSGNSGSSYDSTVDNWYQEKMVPMNQGIFVHDIMRKTTFVLARTGINDGDFSDFIYWNFSGKAPGIGESEEEDGEPARWRSSSFVAVTRKSFGFQAAFKARIAKTNTQNVYVNPVDGIYIGTGPKLFNSFMLSRGQENNCCCQNNKRPDPSLFLSLVKSGMNGTEIDPEAQYVGEAGLKMSLPVTDMGIERDGFRGNTIAINVSMGTEEAGLAGIYMTHISSFYPQLLFNQLQCQRPSNVLVPALN